MMKSLYLLLFFYSFACLSVAQISPGDLSKAHASLEGMSNCTKCHVLGEQVYDSKCLDCHSEIKQRINTGRGYHSSAEVKQKNCRNCHNEHHGRNFKIINFSRDKFDHGKTGFPLTGKHSGLQCEQCHNGKFVSGSTLKRKDTFLGLNSTCSSCHYDYHLTTLGSHCENCHNTSAFRPAPGFSHDKARFLLTGAHKKVNCNSCHPHEKRNGKDFQQFREIAFAGCQNCHKDVHQGKFGSLCHNCHSTNSFHYVSNGRFDHSKTTFPLIGSHQLVLCTGCHKGNMTAKIKHDKCIDCHSDYHKGEFVINNVLQDCSACHNENGFRPSLFSLNQHEETRFNLTGAHLAVSCSVCHQKNNEWKFKYENIQCISCHVNVHGTELSAQFMPDNDCKSCHQTSRWNDINFNHEKTGFLLKGKHKEASCRSCHYKDENQIKIYRFASLENKCESCHKDVHQGQFLLNGISDCSSCHAFDSWSPILFDHNKTRFSLQGAHKQMKCSSCHKPVESNGITFIKYKLEDFKCAACHS